MRFSSEKRLLGPEAGGTRRRRRLLAALVFAVGAAGLLALGQRYPEETADARARLAGPVSSILATLQGPLKPIAGLRQRFDDYLRMEGELARLRAENDELKGWKWRALDLERRLAELMALNNVVGESGYDFVTAGIKARSIGAGSRNALIGVGARDGVTPGAPVLSDRGLAGAIYEVGPSTSRVLFLTDSRSKVSVSIGREFVAAVGLGNGGQRLDVAAGGRGSEIAVGDEVVSAGGLEGVPRGLRVGRIVSLPQGVGIEPYVEFDRLEYVSILLPRGPGRVGKSGGDPARLAARLGAGEAAGEVGVKVKAPADQGKLRPDGE